MAAKEIQGSNIQFMVRASDSGVATYKVMTCEKTVFLDVTNDVTTEKTKCGVFKGVQVADFKLNGEAVHNLTPTSTEVSYDQVLSWQLDRQKIDFKLQNVAYGSGGGAIGAGDEVNMVGQMYFVQTQFDGSDGIAVKFTWAAEGSGTLNDVES